MSPNKQYCQPRKAVGTHAVDSVIEQHLVAAVAVPPNVQLFLELLIFLNDFIFNEIKSKKNLFRPHITLGTRMTQRVVTENDLNSRYELTSFKRTMLPNFKMNKSWKITLKNKSQEITVMSFYITVSVPGFY